MGLLVFVNILFMLFVVTFYFTRNIRLKRLNEYAEEEKKLHDRVVAKIEELKNK